MKEALKEALGYKTQKKSIATQYMQKLVNRFEKFHGKKPVVKKESAYDYAPTQTVLSHTKHIAAKDYPCSICKGTVKKGEVHHRIVYKEQSGKFKSDRYHGNGCSIKEDAPTNSMGGSSSTSGPIQGFDPLLQARRKMMKRFTKFLYGVIKK